MIHLHHKQSPVQVGSSAVVASPTWQVFNPEPESELLTWGLSVFWAGKGVRVHMFFARAVYHVHVILTEFFQPPGNLSLGRPEVQQPRQATVVCPNRERFPEEVTPVLSRKPDHC